MEIDKSLSDNKERTSDNNKLKGNNFKVAFFSKIKNKGSSPL